MEEIIGLYVNDLNDFIVLTDMYCKQLKICLYLFDYNNEFNELLIQLSRYQNIESIDLSQICIIEDIDNGIMKISD